LICYLITESGDPVTGATLLINGEQVKHNTPAEGYYRIKAKRNTRTISVYAFSLGSEEREYSGQDTIYFMLTGAYNAAVSVTNVQKEYINVGYGEVERDKLTTSVGSVSKEKLNQPHYSDIYSMIQGEVPGVMVTGNSILIRGIHTVNASNEPLFVVDGVVVRTISHINPADVESIDVLKGASATIYGVNGANGVILIATKKARKK
ncbi:MAG: TonB-dependent receptor plug domain-containing protein, partial [Bacteroidales bacterium]|nr:TonB-dependent receptor plug domain-containing protein [Bacteroidales bacterium]